MNEVKAVIFDCFGVLYPQAAGSYFDSHKKLFASRPDVLAKLDLQIDLGRITRTEFFDALGAVANMAGKDIQNEIDAALIVDPDLVEFVERLKKHYRIGLLSNAGKEEIEIIFRDNIDNLFDAIAVSYEVGSVKPEPAIYLACAQRLGVEPVNCMYIDDSMANVSAAKKLGMTAVYYPEFGTIPRQLLELLE